MANDDRNRNRVGRYADVRDVAERDMRMARLAAQRKSHTEIARLEGCSERTVARGIERALKAWRAQGGKDLADRILNDLEALYAGLWQIAEDPGHKVSPAGRLVTGLDGEPVVNLDLRAEAYDKARKVLADMRALLGTDAPRRSVQARVEVDLDARLAENEQLLQGRMAQLMQENERLRRQLGPGNAQDADVMDADVVDEGAA